MMATGPAGVTGPLVETLYSCGLRAGEAVALNWSDIDAEMAMVRILHGKGDKFRLVPIGEVALDALDRWRPPDSKQRLKSTGLYQLPWRPAADVARPAAHGEATGRTQRRPGARHAARLPSLLRDPS